ncbi:tetratricopeptide repeat protein [Paraburkholderia phenazinium]|jgi:tetratricopeptide (TPR) repeat protein|uniref:Tetratricopeptide repeat-containing protein n=1 Tax=Paraburkholderia phenazinium TaxID=60549 RepID=A0A1N6JQF9_9BURK|nr:tetratricopeptide repeat protein [Paraburkholderia phenazinium]SIO46582.1 Tetratricopeptide repeat-containing protein [Paraburkholderia phenazinium]
MTTPEIRATPPKLDSGVELLKLDIERDRLRAEIEARRRELDLKERELILQEGEIATHRAANFTPIRAAIIAGATAIIGAVIGALLQGFSNLTLEKSKLESSLILKAVATGNQEDAVKNLEFLLNTHLIEDKEGKLRHAVESAPQSVAVLPAEEYVRSGIASAQGGRIDDAIVAYRKALKLNSQDAMTYNLLGYALLQKGNVGEALENLKTSVKIDPQYVWGYYNLALALWAAGERQEAIEALKSVIKINPNFKAIIADDKQFSQFHAQKDFRALIH